MPKDWTWNDAIAIGKNLLLIQRRWQSDRWGLGVSDSGWSAVTYGGNVYSNDLRKVMIDNQLLLLVYK